MFKKRYYTKIGFICMSWAWDVWLRLVQVTLVGVKKLLGLWLRRYQGSNLGFGKADSQNPR